MSSPVSIRALIDTGASACVIQEGLAAGLGLTQIGTVSINTPSSTGIQCAQYVARLLMSNSVTVETVVIEAPLQGQNIQCLIGRDLLKHGVLVYIGYANLFSLSF